MIPAVEHREGAAAGSDIVTRQHVAALRNRLAHPLVLLEIVLSTRRAGVDLRHIRDVGRPDGQLSPLTPADLGSLAESTADGIYRPNRSAPTLRWGWRCLAATDSELQEAIERVYPGALADWHGFETGRFSATTFREFVARQTGMYRATQQITDEGADSVARAGCDRGLCLRRRCWSTPGMGPAPLTSSDTECLAIPCLEPCALVLDLARWMAKDQESGRMRLDLTPGELESLVAVLRNTLAHPPEDLREGSTRHPANPRRLGLLVERLRELATKAGDPGNKSI